MQTNALMLGIPRRMKPDSLLKSALGWVACSSSTFSGTFTLRGRFQTPVALLYGISVIRKQPADIGILTLVRALTLKYGRFANGAERIILLPGVT